jgi:hypothetical protein
MSSAAPATQSWRRSHRRPVPFPLPRPGLPRPRQAGTRQSECRRPLRQDPVHPAAHCPTCKARFSERKGTPLFASTLPWRRGSRPFEVVSRDRSVAYAQAATEGTSQAEQVADRCHLLKYLREAVERVLDRHSADVDAALKTTETPRNGPATRRSPRPARRHRPSNRPPPSTAERTASGIAATPGRTAEASEANRPVQASPRAPPPGPLVPPDRTRTGPVADVGLPLPTA